jgi:hypothetical protein
LKTFPFEQLWLARSTNRLWNSLALSRASILASQTKLSVVTEIKRSFYTIFSEPALLIPSLPLTTVNDRSTDSIDVVEWRSTGGKQPFWSGDIILHYEPTQLIFRFDADQLEMKYRLASRALSQHTSFCNNQRVEVWSRFHQAYEWLAETKSGDLPWYHVSSNSLPIFKYSGIELGYVVEFTLRENERSCSQSLTVVQASISLLEFVCVWFDAQKSGVKVK